MAGPWNTEFDEVMRAWADAVAQALNGSGSDLREKNLEEALEDVFAGIAQDQPDPPLQLKRQHSVKLDSWFGRLGAADLSLRGDDALALIEAKWGGDSLGNCAWDVVKLATALAEGACTAGYLIAGAPASAWPAAEGAELFTTRPWDADGLFARFGRRFAFWRKDVANYPLRVAAQWWTLEVGRPAVLSVGGDDWQLRVARIVLDEPELVEVDYQPRVRRRSPHPPLPTSADGEGPSSAPMESVSTAVKVVGQLHKLGAGEGFAVYEGISQFLATDEGTMADFLDENEAEDLLDRPVRLRRFSSGGARRVWLEQRRLVEGNAPELLHVRGGSGMGQRWSLDWTGPGSDVKLTQEGPLSGPPVPGARPTTAAWARFWEELDRLGVWDWRPGYRAERVADDAYAWAVLIAIGGRTLRANGEGAFPGASADSEQITPSWADFVEALSDLVGGAAIG